ncbi:MAG: glucose-6-phosphate dehydrogenase [Desulfuromonadaceae bacterium]|nr:glucose-6-phosphate dehydrogenase [Desulfuromonadaceae bacterium]
MNETARDTANNRGGDRASLQGVCRLFDPDLLQSCSLVILGASGDLTARKLIPALFHLFLQQALPDPFLIVGCGRSDLSREDFCRQLRIFASEQVFYTVQAWDSFCRILHYQRLDYEKPEDWKALKWWLDEQRCAAGIGENHLFYLALPPSQHAEVSRQLKEVGLSSEQPGRFWTRLVVEKPFGHDLASAVALDEQLHRSFQEHQIFRIDHYLAKETVQNILMMRFANAIFEPVWNRSHIDYVGIIAMEDLGVEHRSGYYEQAGVLRDMFQNHMMQMLSLVAMEPPSRFEPDRVQDEKAKLFRSLRPFNPKTATQNLILGQYTAATVGGRGVVGYREEPGVHAESCVATYALMRLFVDNWRWSGVPFYLLSGKRLARKETKIVIQFKDVPHSMFRHLVDEAVPANRLELGIYPEERIALRIETKSPGGAVCLQPADLTFDYGDRWQGMRLDAYEKVLLDCLQGERMMFWRQDGVELSWQYLQPVLGRCGEQAVYPYPAGSLGPEQGRDWTRQILELY